MLYTSINLFWKPATHLWNCILKDVRNFRITTLNSYEILFLFIILWQTKNVIAYRSAETAKPNNF